MLGLLGLLSLLSLFFLAAGCMASKHSFLILLFEMGERRGLAIVYDFLSPRAYDDKESEAWLYSGMSILAFGLNLAPSRERVLQDTVVLEAKKEDTKHGIMYINQMEIHKSTREH